MKNDFNNFKLNFSEIKVSMIANFPSHTHTHTLGSHLLKMVSLHISPLVIPWMTGTRHDSGRNLGGHVSTKSLFFLFKQLYLEEKPNMDEPNMKQALQSRVWEEHPSEPVLSSMLDRPM